MKSTRFESPTVNRSVLVPLVSPSPTHITPLAIDFEANLDTFAQEYTLVGIANCTLVGIRYYQEVTHEGEFVTLSREPQNQYDHNAIRVDNIHGERVGHVKKQQASRIAPLMDNSNLTLKIEGTIPHPGNDYSLPLKLEFYSVSPSNAEISDISERSKRIATALKEAMNRDCAFKFAPAFNGHVSTCTEGTKLDVKPPTIENKGLDWKAQAKELNDFFDRKTAEQLKSIPAIGMPLQFRPTVKLFDYQRAGIRWLVHQETASRPMPFFKRQYENRKWVWNCEITRCSQLQAPQLIKGSILADEMGMGKTLQAIGLILAAPPKNYTYPEGGLLVEKEAESAVTEEKEILLKEYTIPALISISKFCTLIVCPVSVMGDWQRQIQTHVNEGVLRVSFYQGPYRAQILTDLKVGNIDVLLVSYHTLAAEFSNFNGQSTAGEEPYHKKRKRETIFDINFHRIILDEAHTIRSSKTNIFKAVMGIKTDRKLALTGTPYVNCTDDVHCLLSFLGVEPLVDTNIFRRAVTQPMIEGEGIGLSRLRTALVCVALRRSKTLVNINLVEKEVKLCAVTFPNDAHKKVYDALFGTFRLAFQAVLRDGESNALKNCTSVFEKILHMRQSCCSATLVPLQRREIALKMWEDLEERGVGKKLSSQEGLTLLETLKGTFNQEKQLPECSICLLEMEEQDCRILRMCSHVFCGLCISRVVESYSGTCPLCRTPFEKSDMIEKSAATTAVTQEGLIPSTSVSKIGFGTAPKILALLEAIKGMKSDEKGVIFSQFTSFMDLIGVALNGNGHSFVRINGSMATSKQNESVSSFNTKQGASPRFILCSPHVTGTEINLTRGNFAFMMDCWWNRAVENQAIDCIYRIGQERKVIVMRFVMKDSIEERIMTLQEAKHIQANGAIEQFQVGEQRKACLSDLKGLLLIEKN